MGLRQKINDLRHWDAARPSFPAEHWLVLGAGLLALRGAGRSRGLIGRMVGRAVGGALIARAASGRDGMVGRLARASAPLPAASGYRGARRRVAK